MPSLIPVLRSAVATHGPFAFKYRQQLAARQEKRGGGGGVALGGSASTTFLAILDGLLLAPLRPRPGQPLPPERARGRAPEVAEACVLWALAWAFGSTLDARERRAFAVGLQAAAVSRSATIKPPLPAEGHLWDYCLDVARQRWLPWVDCLPERARKAARRPDDPILLPAPPPSVGGLLLPTPAAAAGARLVRLIAVAAGASVLVVGANRDGDAVGGARAACAGLLGCVDGPATEFDRARITTEDEARAEVERTEALEKRRGREEREAEEAKKKKKKKKANVVEKVERRPSFDDAQKDPASTLPPPGKGEPPPAEVVFDVSDVPTAATSAPSDLRRAFELRVQRRRGSTFGAAPGSRLLVRMDDVSAVPSKSSEWLRQFLDGSKWRAGRRSSAWLQAADVEDGKDVNAEGVTVVATATDDAPFDGNGPAERAEGRWCLEKLPPRLVGKLAIVRVDDADARALATAFAALVRDHVGGAGAGGRAIHALARATVDLVTKCGDACRKALAAAAAGGGTGEMTSATNITFASPARAAAQRALFDAGAFSYGRRDVARVLQGFLGAQPEDLSGDAAEMTRLWAHEARRALGDRLPLEAKPPTLDRSNFEELMREAAAGAGSTQADDWANVVPADLDLDFVDLAPVAGDDEETFAPGNDGVFDVEQGQAPDVHDDGVDDVRPAERRSTPAFEM